MAVLAVTSCSPKKHGDILVLDHETPPLHLSGRGADADLADCCDSCHKSLLPELSGVVKK